MSNIKLRNYQIEAIDAIEGAVAFGDKEIVLHAETSFGKSITAAGICQRFEDKHVIILVNIEPLIDQIAKFLEILNIDYSILKAGREKEFNTHARVQLVMSQTYYARAKSMKIQANIVIQDEIHKEYLTKRTKTLLDAVEPDFRIGLSATPWDESGYALKDAELISTISCEELTKQGFLAPMKYFVPRWAEKVNYASVKKSGNDYSMTSLDEVIGSPKHIEMMIKAMNEMNAKEKKTLVFASTIEQCDKLESALIKAGYNAAAYHSKKTDKENKRILTSFTNNAPYSGSDEELDKVSLFDRDIIDNKDNRVITHLVSVSKLTTGFSVDDINLGVGGRPTEVKSLWHQIPGRIRRTSYSLTEILDRTGSLNHVALVASYYNEVAAIQKQLQKEKVYTYEVFPYGSKPEGVDHIEYNVRPDKTHGEFLDLGQCLSRHGFPEEEYNPPVKGFINEENKIMIAQATDHLRLEHLATVLPDNRIAEVTRQKYETTVREIMSNKTKLSELTTRQLSDKIDLEKDPVMIIAMLAVLFDKIHNTDNIQDSYGRPARGYVAKNGKNVINFVNGDSIGWMSELWAEKLPNVDSYNKQKYLKSLRTRAKNMLKEKASIWGIRFFIEYLIEQDNEEMEEEMAQVAEEHKAKEQQGYAIEIDIDEDDIPF